MNETTPQSTDPAPIHHTKGMSPVVWAGLAAAATAAVFLTIRSGPSDDPVAAAASVPTLESVEADKELIAAQLELEGERERLAERRAAATATRLEAATLMPRVATIGELVSELEQEVERWASEVLPLRAGEQGRPLAASDESALFYNELVTRADRLPPEGVAELRFAIDVCRTALKRAVNADAEVDVAATRLELARLHKETAEELTRYRDDREAILALLASAAAEGRTSDLTIQERLSGVHARWANDRQAAFAEAMEAEYKVTTDALVEAAVRNERARRKLELSRQEQERKLKESEATAARLKQLAEDPTVRARFTAFLDKGKYRYAGTASRHEWSYPQSQPASLSNLERLGVLKDRERYAAARSDARRLYKLLGYNEQIQKILPVNDRRCPSYPQSPDDWERAEEEMEILRQVGSLWVADGTLKN